MLFRQIRAIKNSNPIKIIFATISAVGGFFLASQLIKLLSNIMPIDSDKSGVICVTLGKILDIGFVIFFVEIALIIFVLLYLIKWVIEAYTEKKDINLAQEQLETEKILNELEDDESGWTDKQAMAFVIVAIVIFLVANCALSLFMFRGEVVYRDDKIIEYTITDRKGTTVNYRDAKKYYVSDDDHGNAMITIEMKNGEEYTIGGDTQTMANKKYDNDSYGELVKLDEVLQSYNIRKVVDCTKDDFDYDGKDKNDLDILLKNKTKI